jgi:hypothetical protein
MGVPEPSPFVYSIDTAARIVSAEAAGTLTFCSILNYASGLRVDRRFSPAFSEIVDLRRVESVSLSAREAMALADNIDPFSASSKRAFVVRSQVQVHVAHLHRILRTASKTIRVFFSIEEARAWIANGSEASAARAR